MDEWPEAFWIAVSLLVMSLVLIFVVDSMNLGQSINNARASEVDTINQIKEYREYNSYNDKVVYAADIASFIIEKKGEPYCKVDIDGTIYLWQSSDAVETTAGIPKTMSTPCDATLILETIDINRVYKSTLVTGVNGELVGINFVAQ